LRRALLGKGGNAFAVIRTGAQCFHDSALGVPGLGLAVSEVLTNALRHGFRDRAEGAVTVDASIAAGELAVRIADDGIGMAAESDSSGLGSRIIRSLTTQLRASLQVESRVGAGTVVTIRLPADAEEPAQDSAATG